MQNFNVASEVGGQTQSIAKVADYGRTNRRLSVFMAVISSLIIFVLAIATARLVRQLTSLASPLVYSSEQFLPLRSSICAGEPVQAVVTSTVQDAPIRVSIYGAIWNMDTRRTVRSDTGPISNLIFLREDIGRVITSTVTYSTTQGLPPGHYEFRRLAQALERAPQVYAVPFTVTVEGCK